MSPRAEPEPNWRVVRLKITWLWPFHYIGFGCSSVFLAMFSIWSFYRIIQAGKKSTKRYFLTICFLLFAFATMRSLYLLLDPYGSHINLNLPTLVEAILSGIAYPCLTSAFTLVFLSLLEVTKLQAFPRSVQNIRLVAPILLLHFAVVVCSDIAGAVFPSAIAAVVLCRAIFLLWGAFVFSSFLYAGAKVFKAFFSANKNLEDVTAERGKFRRVQLKFRRQLSKVCKITAVASFLGLCLCVLQVYSLARVYRFISVHYISKVSEVWEWWICESLYRLIELAMGCLLCYIVYLPINASPPPGPVNGAATYRQRSPPLSTVDVKVSQETECVHQ